MLHGCGESESEGDRHQLRSRISPLVRGRCVPYRTRSLIRVHSSSDFALAVRPTKPGEGDLVYVGYATDVSRWTAEALTAIKECRKTMHEAHPWGHKIVA